MYEYTASEEELPNLPAPSIPFHILLPLNLLPVSLSHTWRSITTLNVEQQQACFEEGKNREKRCAIVNSEIELHCNTPYVPLFVYIGRPETNGQNWNDTVYTDG